MTDNAEDRAARQAFAASIAAFLAVVGAILMLVWPIGCASARAEERRTLLYIGVCSTLYVPQYQCTSMDSFTLSMGQHSLRPPSDIHQYASFEAMTKGPWIDCVPVVFYRVDWIDGKAKLVKLKKKYETEEVVSRSSVTREVPVDEAEEP